VRGHRARQGHARAGKRLGTGTTVRPGSSGTAVNGSTMQVRAIGHGRGGDTAWRQHVARPRRGGLVRCVRGRDMPGVGAVVWGAPVRRCVRGHGLAREALAVQAREGAWHDAPKGGDVARRARLRVLGKLSPRRGRCAAFRRGRTATATRPRAAEQDRVVRRRAGQGVRAVCMTKTRARRAGSRTHAGSRRSEAAHGRTVCEAPASRARTATRQRQYWAAVRRRRVPAADQRDWDPRVHYGGSSAHMAAG